MNICKFCGSVAVANTNTGELTFRCRCGRTYLAEPMQTMLYDQNINAAESAEKYSQLVKNAPYDHGRMLIDKPCEKCGLPFMTMVRVGEQEKTIFVCNCE